MKEKPIIFSGEMVRAILDGRKTVTRRIIKPQPPEECGIHYPLGKESYKPLEEQTPLRHHWEAWQGGLYDERPAGHLCGSFTVNAPCAPGDMRWVREKFRYHPDDRLGMDDECPVEYAATPVEGDAFEGCRWRSPLYMPRWASRITLEVVGVRAERLQEITLEDVNAEGTPDTLDASLRPYGSRREQFQRLWDTINAKPPSLLEGEPDHSWDANPWVWRIEFRRVEK